MIAGCSLVHSSPANPSNVVGTTIFPSGQRPLMPAVSGRTLTGQELRLAAEDLRRLIKAAALPPSSS
jgi:enamine deaminase RidA (YjgF/YER057c/UK114 family)